MSDDRPEAHIEIAPPLIDLTGRPAPTPGPLTKPSPTVRPPKKPRWKILLVAVLVVAAAVGGGIAWRASQTAPLPWYSSSELGSGVGFFGSIEERLETMITKYETADEDGSLWELIPESRSNQTALLAFRFFLTDMKVAATMGTDFDEALDYANRSDELERLFLDEKPFGENIEFTFAEDRVFRYDGETGEGGYSAD